MDNWTLPQDTLIGDYTMDRYVAERSEFRTLGKNIAEIIAKSVTSEQLNDIKGQLLLLAVAANRTSKSAHSSALLTETIAKLHEYQKKNNPKNF